MRLLLTMATAVAAMTGRCGHAERQNFAVPSVPIERNSTHGRDLQRGTSWAPIRMQAYYGDLKISASMESRLRGAVEGAINWYQSFLSVRPVTAAWRVTEPSCNEIPLGGAILSESLDLDYAFYIVADEEDNGLAGYALYCQQDEGSGQPILGLYYFNGATHAEATDEAVLSTTIHEMTHALVFSSELYTQYIKPDGTKYTDSEIYVTESVRGMSKLKLAFPTIVSKARAGFGCTALNGVELESDGGSGSAGVHWEKRIMYNDYMIADSDITDIAYTDVSLALFEDSGWYHVDYQYSTSISWGYHEGCEFLSEKCVADYKPISAEFCTDQPSREQRDCDFLRLRKGTCNLSTSSEELPSAYQYFSNAYEGGSDPYVDYCPVVKPYVNGDCRNPASAVLSPDYAEEAGYQSRCITGTYSKSGSRQEHSACHVVQCRGATAIITIGDTEVECAPGAGDIEVEGMEGVVHCPQSDVLCRSVPCVNNCYGYGVCNAGQCVCDDGTDSCQLGFTAHAHFLDPSLYLGFIVLSLS